MGKLFLIVSAMLVGGLALSIYEDSKLSPAQKHAKECRDHGMASVMALTFAKSRLNLAERPEFETFGSSKIAKLLKQDEPNCSIEVADHITFKNEMGGKSRRYLRAVVAPIPDAPGKWQLLEFAVQ